MFDLLKFGISFETFQGICIGVAIFLFVIIIINVIYDDITKYSKFDLRKSMSLARSLKDQKSNIDKSYAFKTSIRKWYNAFSKFIPFSSVKRAEYKDLILKLGKTSFGSPKIPEEYYVYECTLLVCSLLLSIVFLFFIGLPALIILLVGILLRAMIIRALRIQLKENIKEIDSNLPELISMMRFNYGDESAMVFSLVDLVHSFQPLANDAVARVLSNLEIDIQDEGEFAAARKLEESYQDSKYLPRIAQICIGLINKQEAMKAAIQALYNETREVVELEYDAFVTKVVNMVNVPVALGSIIFFTIIIMIAAFELLK